MPIKLCQNKLIGFSKLLIPITVVLGLTISIIMLSIFIYEDNKLKYEYNENIKKEISEISEFILTSLTNETNKLKFATILLSNTNVVKTFIINKELSPEFIKIIKNSNLELIEIFDINNNLIFKNHIINFEELNTDKIFICKNGYIYFMKPIINNNKTIGYIRTIFNINNIINYIHESFRVSYILKYNKLEYTGFNEIDNVSNMLNVYKILSNNDSNIYFIKEKFLGNYINFKIIKNNLELKNKQNINIYNLVLFFIIVLILITPIIYIVSFFSFLPISKLSSNIKSEINNLIKKYNLKIYDYNISNSDEIEKLLLDFEFLIKLVNKSLAELDEKDRRMSLLIDNINIGLVEIDETDHRIVNINKYLCNLLNVEKESVLNSKCFNIICKNGNSINCSSKNLLRMESISSEKIIVNDKIQIPILRNAIKIPVNGHCNIVESIIDITQNKNKELELSKAKEIAEKEKHKALKLTELKTILLSNASHDLGNSLTRISGITDILIAKCKINLPDECNNLLDIIKLNIDSMALSINLMREKTMQELGIFTLRLTPYNLNDVINRVYDSHKQLLGISNQIIFYKTVNILNIKLLDSVLIDVSKIETVLMNLIGNAIKFTKKGSVDLIVTVNEKDENKLSIKFEVIDTGIGVSPENIKTIFNPYEQANTEIHKEFGGFGIGLAIVKNYVELMGGKIEVQSKINEGSKFYFTLLIEKYNNQNSELDNIDINTINLTNINVLLAEDDEINRMILEDKLKSFGCNIISFEDGSDLIKYFRGTKDKIDIILTDIRMANISGDEAIFQLKKINKLIPVLAVTANYSEMDLINYKKLGFNGCIYKPLKDDELKTKIYKSINFRNYDYF